MSYHIINRQWQVIRVYSLGDKGCCFVDPTGVHFYT